MTERVCTLWEHGEPRKLPTCRGSSLGIVTHVIRWADDRSRRPISLSPTEEGDRNGFLLLNRPDTVPAPSRPPSSDQLLCGFSASSTGPCVGTWQNDDRSPLGGLTPGEACVQRPCNTHGLHERSSHPLALAGITKAELVAPASADRFGFWGNAVFPFDPLRVGLVSLLTGWNVT